jgi:hypothetical protein
MIAVFFLFLLHLSVGLVLTLEVVPEKAGVRFLKLCSAAASLLTTGGLWLLYRRYGPEGPAPALPLYRPLLLAASVFLISTILYNRAQHFGRTRASHFCLAVATASGLTAVAVAARGPLELSADITSTLLLGAASAAMVLGHYYLVVLDLPIQALRRLSWLLIAALLARTLVVVIALVGPLAAGYEPARLVATGTFSPDGIFVWMRLLFGIVGPWSLSWFIWKTVEIRSTQSATGILYVQLFLVLAGELLATHLRVVAGLPL